MDEDSAPNGLVTGWDYANEKFDMKVPERILVVGQDQHLGKSLLDFNTNQSLLVMNSNYFRKPIWAARRHCPMLH